MDGEETPIAVSLVQTRQVESCDRFHAGDIGTKKRRRCLSRGRAQRKSSDDGVDSDRCWASTGSAAVERQNERRRRRRRRKRVLRFRHGRENGGMRGGNRGDVVYNGQAGWNRGRKLVASGNSGAVTAPRRVYVRRNAFTRTFLRARSSFALSLSLILSDVCKGKKTIFDAYPRCSILDSVPA